jgi:hypothetical protein
MVGPEETVVADQRTNEHPEAFNVGFEAAPVAAKDMFHRRQTRNGWRTLPKPQYVRFNVL